MASMDLEVLRQWIGRSERMEGRLDPQRCAQLAAALDLDHPPAVDEPLPLPWHWIFFTPAPRASETGPDGHPARGGFLPPVPLPRRMWAGSRVRIDAPLVIGEAAARESTVVDIREKTGRQGRLVFVTVRHRYFNGHGDPAMEEKQDLVYREPAASASDDSPPYESPLPAQWREACQPDPVLLFRYSALSYNAHRIHYDRDWTVREEGYPGLVVQGPLTATLLLNLLYRNRPGCGITEFSFRGVRPLFEGTVLELQGAVEGESVSLWALTPEGRLAMEMSCRLAAGYP